MGGGRAGISGANTSSIFGKRVALVEKRPEVGLEAPRWRCLCSGGFSSTNKPVALFVMVGGIVASGWLGLDARGMKLLGEIPQGLPALGFPAIHWANWDELLPLAFACFLLRAVVI